MDYKKEYWRKILVRPKGPVTVHEATRSISAPLSKGYYCKTGLPASTHVSTNEGKQYASQVS